jgi:LytS/YehU family sensor histidine kinase
MQLSQLMRYALYETNGERIDLSKEIEMAGHFIELQKLRLPLDFPIDFEIEGEIKGITIAPFLLMPLIENMFKHGTEFASISLKAAKNRLTLITVNAIRKPTRDEPGGIGLANLRRRLSYLYPDKHFLGVESNAGRFQTTLTLILN